MLKKYYNEIYSLSKYYKQPLVTYDYFLSKFIKHSNSIKLGWVKYQFHMNFDNTKYIVSIENQLKTVMNRIYKELNNNNLRVSYVINYNINLIFIIKFNTITQKRYIAYSIPDNFDKYECHEMLYYQIRNILIKKDNEIERIYNNGYFRY